MTWQVLESYPVRPGTLGGRAPVMAWRPSPHYPPAATAAAARRALMVSLLPDLAGATDAHIARHYAAWQRNVGAHKLARAGRAA